MKTPVPPQQDQTCGRLRQWVTVGRFLPGERPKIQAIAQQLGAGVMPPAWPQSNRLLEVPASLRVINEAHGDAVMALRQRDSAGVRRAVEKDLFVAAQFLRPFCA